MSRAAAAPNAEPAGLESRAAALDILDSVLNRKNPLDSALEDNADFAGLDTRDRAFCRMLTATTLRRLGQIDDLIRQTEDRPASRPAVIDNVLRIGAAQILFMDVPDHAAVDTAVRMCAALGLERQKNFVNALLRNIARNGTELRNRQDEARLNTPEWLLKEWIAAYGLKAAAQIAQANLGEAPLDITVKDPGARVALAAGLKATTLGSGTLRLPPGSGSVTELPGFANGSWWVQDASASIPAQLLGDIAGKTVVDLCAAPGGKTMQLAAMGARVIAIDRSAQRLQRLEANLLRTGLQDRVEIVVADAAEWRPPTPPVFVLADAPCTATGTIRRNPDVPHHKTPADQARLVTLQQRILENAYKQLAPGGLLIYCTCSLQRAEGEDQIARLLAAQAGAVKIGITPVELGGLDEAVTAEGDARILPFHRAAGGGMDGFFVARIRRS